MVPGLLHLQRREELEIILSERAKGQEPRQRNPCTWHRTLGTQFKKNHCSFIGKFQVSDQTPPAPGLKRPLQIKKTRLSLKLIHHAGLVLIFDLFNFGDSPRKNREASNQGHQMGFRWPITKMSGLYLWGKTCHFSFFKPVMSKIL